MNTPEIKGNWEEQKGRLKQKLAVLMEGDFLLAKDRKEEIIVTLQLKLGKTREELNKIIGVL